LLAFFVSACVALPVASPPLQVTALWGRQTPTDSRVPSDVQADEFRLGIAPAALMDDLRARRFDASAGVLIERMPHGPLALDEVTRPEAPARRVPGAYAAVEWYPLLSAWGGRARVQLMTDLLVAGDQVGGGGRFGVGVSWARFVDEPAVASDADDDGGSATYIGWFHGEVEIGALLTAGWHTLPDAPNVWSVGAALDFRLPASLGVLFIPVSQN
jgi:hypothetical protein